MWWNSVGEAACDCAHHHRQWIAVRQVPCCLDRERALSCAHISCSGCFQVLLPLGLDPTSLQARQFLQSIALSALHAFNGVAMHMATHAGRDEFWVVAADIASSFIMPARGLLPGE